MKFLLTAVNAKYIHSNPAVYSLKAYAGQRAWEGGSAADHVEIAEYTINQRTEDILADIYLKKPDVIGFSCYIWNIGIIRELLLELPKILPGTPVWLGGPEVSWQAEKLLEEYPEVSGVMLGEGEETFLELLIYYLGAAHSDTDGMTLSDIAGLCCPEGITGERAPLELDSLPFYYRNLDGFSNRIIYYESSRGCPYRCSYCLSSVEKTLRFRSLELVKKELDYFLERKVAQVKFIDRTFNCRHGHAKAIWRHLAEHDNGITNFHFEIAADILDEEELGILRGMRPGLVQLEIGVQSTNRRTLDAINRQAPFEKIMHSVGQIQEGRNIHQHLDLIAGLPYEDYDSFIHSCNQVYALRPEQLQLGFLKVLKGTGIHKKSQEYGIVYRQTAPYEVLYTRWLPYEKVLKLKRIEEMLEIYYNSSQFTHMLPVLEQSFPHPFALYEALADYYGQQGYFVNTPSRTYRYEVLLQFACKTDMMKKELYIQLLTYDLYLRENLKSRPAFAKEQGEYRDRFRAFFEAEETLYQALPGYSGYTPKQVARMTHIERFDYPVWEEDAAKACVKLPVSCFVLFDYQDRNPLNREAHTVCLE